MQKYLSLMVLLVAVACTAPKGYEIKGTWKTDESSMVYLQKRIDGVYETIDSVQVIDGVFNFKGSSVQPDYYVLRSGNSQLGFFLEDGTTSVIIDSLGLSEANVSGGITQTTYNEYVSLNLGLENQLDEVVSMLRAETNDSLKLKLNQKGDSIYELMQKMEEQFMKDHAQSAVSPYLLTQLQYGKTGKELAAYLSVIDSTLNYTETYRSISKRVKLLESVEIGKIAPDFEMDDVDGNSILLSSIYSKYEYLLIDFWASWCGPCKMENPNVVNAYKQFQTQGFSVLGISLDKDHTKWIDAIEKDTLTWTHLSDLKGWDNSAAKVYGVNSIPANFLVNRTGEIVAVNLREADLTDKLSELMKK